MKKNIGSVLSVFTFLIIFNLCNTSYSQSLQFCEDVSKDGVPLNTSTVFNISSDGGYLKCLTTLPYRVGTTIVSYEIYKVDADGYETYDNTIEQEVDPSWTWFWKKITFYKAGNYSFDVYDCFDYRLTSGSVKIQIK